MKEFDVVIVGAGVTGTALAYVLTNFTTIKNIALVEKEKKVAQIQSKSSSNSQTLHLGDIETQYTLEKAKQVKKDAGLIVNYLKRNKGIHLNIQKMVLAVGKEEIQELKKHYSEIKEPFPGLKVIDRAELEKIEPNVVLGRDPQEEVMAIYSPHGYAVDFGKLAESFVEHSTAETFFGQKIKKIIPEEKKYILEGNKLKIKARFVVVCSSGNSLTFAHKLGYWKNLILLPIAGSFFFSKKVLRGKVYRMQDKRLPFAAPHGDPDVNDKNITRFGPTARFLPMLERYNYRSIFDFLKLIQLRFSAISSLIKITLDPHNFNFVVKNICYDLPFIGKLMYFKNVKKIVPSLKINELHHGKKIGGIRPQIIDITTRTINLGEAKEVGKNIIFNLTPSPGASVCLANAVKDARIIVKSLGGRFDEDKFKEELG